MGDVISTCGAIRCLLVKQERHLAIRIHCPNLGCEPQIPCRDVRARPNQAELAAFEHLGFGTISNPKPKPAGPWARGPGPGGWARGPGPGNGAGAHARPSFGPKRRLNMELISGPGLRPGLGPPAGFGFGLLIVPNPRCSNAANSARLARAWTSRHRISGSQPS